MKPIQWPLSADDRSATWRDRPYEERIRMIASLTRLHHRTLTRNEAPATKRVAK